VTAENQTPKKKTTGQKIYTETRGTGPKIQKNVLADRKELLSVPSQQTTSMQTNTQTRLDIRYPTVGLHQTKQYRNYAMIPEQRISEHCQCTLVY